MAEGRRFDILSMALQQTGVEQTPVLREQASVDNFQPPTDLNSLLDQDLFANFTAPSTHTIKQEPTVPLPSNGVPGHLTVQPRDPLSLACATYLNPSSIKQSQAAYNGAQTELKSEPMEFSSNTFNLEDIDFDFMDTTSDPNTSQQVLPLVDNSFPQLRDDELSRLLDDITRTDFQATTPTFSAPSRAEYSFPPRYPPNHYPSYNGRGVVRATQLVSPAAARGVGVVRATQLAAPAASVNGPSLTPFKRTAMMLQNRGVRRPLPTAVQKFKMNPNPQVSTCTQLHPLIV